MKLNPDFVMRQVAGTWVVIPFGDTAGRLNGMIRLNETGAFLWEALVAGAQEKELADRLLAEYAVSRENAEADVADFLRALRQAGCLIEE